MSNKSRLQTNNTNLQALINKANSLPEASGGSGGGSAEICDVKIQCSQEFLDYSGIVYFEIKYLTSNNKIEEIPRYIDENTVIDGAITSADQFLLLENIKCNSMIYINNSYSDISYIEEDNYEDILYHNMGGVYILIGSAYADQTVTFTFTTD